MKDAGSTQSTDKVMGNG